MKDKLKTIIITGTSGSGKTTTLNLLREEGFQVHDIDDKGVPKDADEKWRKKRTKELLEIACINQGKGTLTILGGVIIPKEVTSCDLSDGLNIHYVFLTLSRDLIEKRLLERGWDEKFIEQNINWSSHLKKQVLSQQNILEIDTNNNTPQEVVEKIRKLVD